jgi:hypothetical protein
MINTESHKKATGAAVGDTLRFKANDVKKC